MLYIPLYIVLYITCNTFSKTVFSFLRSRGIPMLYIWQAYCCLGQSSTRTCKGEGGAQKAFKGSRSSIGGGPRVWRCTFKHQAWLESAGSLMKQLVSVGMWARMRETNMQFVWANAAAFQWWHTTPNGPTSHSFDIFQLYPFCSSHVPHFSEHSHDVPPWGTRCILQP